MASNTPKWVKEIQAFVDAVAYGDVSVEEIKRVNRRVVGLKLTSKETLRYVNNVDAINDILAFLTNLLDVGHTGVVQFEVELKDGQINILAIKNTREI